MVTVLLLQKGGNYLSFGDIYGMGPAVIRNWGHLFYVSLCQLSSPTSYFCSVSLLQNILLELGSKHVCWNKDGGNMQFKQMATIPPEVSQSNHVGRFFFFVIFPTSMKKMIFFPSYFFREMVELSVKQIMIVGLPLQQWQFCSCSLKKGRLEVPYNLKRQLLITLSQTPWSCPISYHSYSWLCKLQEVCGKPVVPNLPYSGTCNTVLILW